MTGKINLSIDVSKLHKERFVERTYKNKVGEDVTQKEMKLTVMELKVPRVITSGESWELHKTHVVVETPTKEERANKVNTDVVGEGTQFVSKEATDEPHLAESIPF